MNFYETQMGHQFYGKTIPRIAMALEQIAKALDKPAPAVRLPCTCKVPVDFLPELYQGNYDPSSEPDTEEVSRCSAEILAKEAALHDAVSPEIWEQIIQLLSLFNKRSSLQQEQAFSAGFRAAVMMLVAGLMTPGPEEAVQHDGY